MKVRRGLASALLGAGLVVPSCSAERGTVPVEASADAPTSTTSVEMLPEARAAALRIAELRTRFRLPVRSAEDDHPVLALAAPAKLDTRAALGTPVATGFEAATGPDAATHVRAVLPTEALGAVTRRAHVALPVRADDEVKLEDESSRLSVRFALEHVQSAHIEMAGGLALYRGALDGADVLHRVHAEGTEDFVVFEKRPAREELSYSVDVSRVRGLRLVSNTLEFLDETGTPLLRVAPPYVVDSVGGRHEATLAVSGCAYDASPAGPWGRNVTKPGAERCTVRVAWGRDVEYPAMVDPAWGATGSMAIARQGHTASVLGSGKVLVAGGCKGTSCSGSAGSVQMYLASAELYDPDGNAGAGTFAATGAMATARLGHTASVLGSGKVLIAGGQGPGLASAELYDPAGNAGGGTFAATGAMATARFFHTASVLPSGRVLVAGGGNDAAYLASAELFDPTGNAGAGTFAATASMATARVLHTASVLGSGKVLVAGGEVYGGGAIASAELFDPAGNAGGGVFAATGTMAIKRGSHTASVLPSGSVLVAGGRQVAGREPLANAEIFDPAGNAGAGIFAATDPMATARERFTATVLPSGKVLVAGGQGPGRAPLASAEVFDPAGKAGAGTFAATNSFATARHEHTASVLPSGQVLVAGGEGESFAALASAEVYGGTRGDACTADGTCLAGLVCSAATATCGPCISVNDCVAPTVCGPTGRCVPPPAEAGSDGGCAVSGSSAGGDVSTFVWLAAAAGLVLVRRRRGRRSAGSIAE